MQTVRALTAAFCLACIGAELTAQLVDAGWARQCIKALAGLYILVVLLRQTWGTETGLQIRLTSDGTAAQAQQVWVEFRPECPAEMQEQILNFLEQELGTRPERQEEA